MAAIISVVLHAVILALLLFVTTKVEQPLTEAPPIVLEWGGGGDDAAAGTPDAGQGNNPSDAGRQLEDPTVTEPVPEPAPVPPPKASTPPPSKSKPTVEAPKQVATATDPDVAAIRKAQEAERRRQQAEADERRLQESERQRLAQEEADRKRQEQEEYDKKKGKFGNAFGGGSGTGSGNTGKPGNQGQPGGAGSNPFGQGPGAGGGSGGGSGTGTGVSIGGGLAGRKVVGRPNMVDNTQKVGKIMLEVCVDSDGSVVSADYTLRGSTTNDGELRSKAIQWAKQHRFAPSDNPKECGTFAFNFQVK